MLRHLIWLVLPLALAACGAEPKWAPDEQVRAAAYHSGNPPSVTLFTVVGIPRGQGGHSGLMIDGSERIMFDPAGTWYHPNVPERNDVHFGITDKMKAFYIDYHARETYFVREQKVPVTPQVAEMLIQRAEAHGAAPKAFCASAVTDVLSGVPGFEGVGRTFSPITLSKRFAELPGVTSKDNYDGDPANHTDVLMVQARDKRR